MMLLACIFHTCSEASIYYVREVDSVVVELKCVKHDILPEIEIWNEQFYYHYYYVASDSIPALIPSANFNISKFYTNVWINKLEIPAYFNFYQIPQTDDCTEMFLTITKLVPQKKNMMCFSLTVYDLCKPQKTFYAAYLVYKGKIVLQMTPVISTLKYYYNCLLSLSTFEAIIGEKLSANQHFTVQFLFNNGLVAANSSLHLRIVDYADNNTDVSTLGYLMGVSFGIMKVTEGAFILQLGTDEQAEFAAGAKVTLFVYKDAVEYSFTVTIPATATSAVGAVLTGASAYRFVVFDDIEEYWRMLLEDPKMQIDKAISVAETTLGLWAFMLDVDALKIRHVAINITHRYMHIVISHTNNTYLETWEMSVFIHESEYYLADQTLFEGYSSFQVELSADDDAWIRSQRFPQVYLIDHGHKITIDDVYMRTFEYLYVYYAIIAATCVYALLVAVKA